MSDLTIKEIQLEKDIEEYLTSKLFPDLIVK